MSRRFNACTQDKHRRSDDLIVRKPIPVHLGLNEVRDDIVREIGSFGRYEDRGSCNIPWQLDVSVLVHLPNGFGQGRNKWFTHSLNNNRSSEGTPSRSAMTIVGSALA